MIKKTLPLAVGLLLSAGAAQVDLGKSAGDFGDFTLSLSQAEEEAGNPNGDDVIAFVSWSKSF
jgi:hypothetical protein